MALAKYVLCVEGNRFIREGIPYILGNQFFKLYQTWNWLKLNNKDNEILRSIVTLRTLCDKEDETDLIS